MRENKFRAWDKKYEDMLYSDVQTEEYEFRFTENGIEVYEYSDDFTNPMNVELMQFTGLYDKHHKPIYEGDIVESFTKINGYVCRGVVIFENGKFMVDVKKADFSRNGFISDFDLKIREYEVIGNIYENPELIN